MFAAKTRLTTSEGIEFGFILASPLVRFVAWAIDFAATMALLSALRFAVIFISFFSSDFASAMVILLYFVVSVGYPIFCEWKFRGQTIGKKLLSLRVVDAEGFRLTFQQVFVRNITRMVDMLPLPYLVGGLVCFLSPRNQRLGDLAANTIVIRNVKVEEPVLSELGERHFNSLRHYPHLEARLRREVTPEEAALILNTLLRSSSLEATARIKIYGLLASHFRDIVQFPAEAVEGIPDEQYLKNIVDVLFRKSGAVKARETRVAK
ncbi:MAG: domain containing protein [Verrucomicrobiales bacterium]|nr:domain containing protein [Verrucomicrobiales bacterium]